MNWALTVVSIIVAVVILKVIYEPKNKPHIKLMLLAGTLVVVFVAVRLFWPTGWYALLNHVDVSNVVIQDRPHNCDFTWSPMGEKGCHYGKSVVLKTDTDAKHTRYVYVVWDRVED